MIAFPIMAVAPAGEAGIKVPPDPDNYDPQDYPHFAVFCKVQLGAPMPNPSAHWENAKIVAGVSDADIMSITYQQLLDLGLSIGFS